MLFFAERKKNKTDEGKNVLLLVQLYEPHHLDSETKTRLNWGEKP